jgi:hypothetical protein
MKEPFGVPVPITGVNIVLTTADVSGITTFVNGKIRITLHLLIYPHRK